METPPLRDARLVAAASSLGFLGVALGAFAAHSLRLEGKPLEWWHTATQYGMIHCVAALLAAILGARRSGWLFLAGTVVFSGSLYAMALTDIRILGAITPVGGLCFLGGWALLVLQANKAPKASP